MLGLKYTKLLNSFCGCKWKEEVLKKTELSVLVSLVVKKEGKEACSCLVFTFQTREPGKKRQGSTRKESFLFYLFHWILFMFWLSVKHSASTASGFCFFRVLRVNPAELTDFLQTCWISMAKVEKKEQTNKNKKTKNKKKNAERLLLFFIYIACNLRLFAHSSSKRKY